MVDESKPIGEVVAKHRRKPLNSSYQRAMRKIFSAWQEMTYEEHSATFRSQSLEDVRGEVSIRFRPIGIEDEGRLRDFFASHTEETIHLRYGMALSEMTRKRALQLVQLDGHNEMALVGLVADVPTVERIVAVGRYALDEATNLVDVAFVVHEAYRGLGIATHLLRRLVAIIREKGFVGISAQVLATNFPMLHVFKAVLGQPDQSDFGYGEITQCWQFASTNPTVAL